MYKSKTVGKLKKCCKFDSRFILQAFQEELYKLVHSS